MNSITEIEPKLLSLLEPQRAVDLFRRLLWAEARHLGLGPTRLSVPTNIYAPDGGIDAEVVGVPQTATGQLLFPGVTCYQIKTGDFTAGNDTGKKALFLKDNGKEFKDRVRTCFEKGGTFVAVLFGSDAVDAVDGSTAKACREFVGRLEPRFGDRKIEILAQNQLATLFNQHLALVAEIEGRSLPNLRTHSHWAAVLNTRYSLRLGAEQQAFLSQTQTELRKESARHICVWGEPGVGKTRLLYEATAAEDLSSSVAYFGSPKALAESGVVDLLVRNPGRGVLLVVDDCEPRERENIWSQLKHLGARVRLVTAQHDVYDASGMTTSIPVPALPEAQISEMLQDQGVEKHAADRFAPYCGGSPRVAEVISWNLANNPEDLTRPLDTGNVWDRFVAGTDDSKDPAVASRRLVLQHLALFRRFGFGGHFSREAKAIAAQIQRVDGSVTWPRFVEIVNTLKKRRILQGESTLYITPRLLHIKLWCDWWDTFGGSFSLQEFLDETPDSLHSWFYEMFEYAHGSEVARKAVRIILDKQGPFLRGHLLKTEHGARFFLTLTEADTETALECLESTIGTDSSEDLHHFKAGRPHIVWALEKIAVERRLFVRAARLLLRLAETENTPGISNNASGTFAGLFSLGYARTASTQAPPDERFPVLVSALTSASKGQRLLAFRACDQALESHHFSRMAGPERRGLIELELWKPKTYGEWFAAFEQVWKLATEILPNLPTDEQTELGNVLLKHAFALLRIERLAELVTTTVEQLVEMAQISRKELLRTSRFVVENSVDLPAPLLDRWRKIEPMIFGDDAFVGRLKRYVGVSSWELSLADLDRSKMEIERLSAEAVLNPDLVYAQLEWLASREAENVDAFGAALGRADPTFSMLAHLTGSLENSAHTGLLGGYLRSLHESAPDRWDQTIQELGARPIARKFVPALLMASGLSDSVAGVLEALVASGDIAEERLADFIFGARIRQLSVPVFVRWIAILLAKGDQAALSAAVRLLHHYAATKENPIDLPMELLQSVLLHEALFTKADSANHGARLDFDWSETADYFLKRFPGQKIEVARALLQGIGMDGPVIVRFGQSYSYQVLNQIAHEFPAQVWEITWPLLGPPIDSRAYAIQSWLEGDNLFGARRATSFISSVPASDLWRWVDRDVEQHAWYMARLAPKDLRADSSQHSVVRELLMRYGDRDDVKNALEGQYFTGGWMGSASAHYASIKEQLTGLLETETEPVVREWLYQCVRHLEQTVEQERLLEERMGF